MENKLEVWKLSHQIVVRVYRLTDRFPKSEQFGLISQLKRSISSVPANIVEGQARQYKKEFIQFLFIAKGSMEESHYHLFLAKDLGYISETEYEELKTDCNRVKMMLHKLIQSLKER